jgi:hypothetical protein
MKNKEDNSLMKSFEPSSNPNEKNIIKRDISKLISACNFDFLPKLLKNRKICLSDIMKKELEGKTYKDEECVKEFCFNCCFINYGNPNCKICDKK